MSKRLRHPQDSTLNEWPTHTNLCEVQPRELQRYKRFLLAECRILKHSCTAADNESGTISFGKVFSSTY